MSSSQWFDVDRAGLAAILERRGKSFALFELIQNAFDANPSKVKVEIDPVAGRALAHVVIEDDGDGFADLDHAHTMFARSSRAFDPNKRGRFNLGEKLVLSLCTEAKIESTSGTVIFDSTGRKRYPRQALNRGTRFNAHLRMTRDEIADIRGDVFDIIPPAGVALTVRIGGVPASKIERPEPIVVFEATLPTEFADDDGNMRRTSRKTFVEVFDASHLGGEDAGALLEMGLPVVADTGTGFVVNVQQKIPLNFDRDSVTPAYLRALNAVVLNHTHDKLTTEQASETWVAEAMGDARASGEAVSSAFKKRFGDRAVIATPGDPLANANAAASGCAVVSGGALPAAAWSNVRKHSSAMPSAQVFPSPKPEQIAERHAEQNPEPGQPCPTCGQPMP